MAGYQVGQ